MSESPHCTGARSLASEAGNQAMNLLGCLGSLSIGFAWTADAGLLHHELMTFIMPSLRNQVP